MQIISSFGVPIAIIAIAIAVLGVLVFIARNYMRCPPNEVLVLFGRKHQFAGPDGKMVTRGYRLITGGAAFRLPLLEEAQRLSLAVFQISVKIERAPNKDGVPVTVSSVANVRLASDQALLGAAVEQFLGKTPPEIQGIIHKTLEGIVRQLVGTLTVEEMVRDRETISRRVIELTGAELAKLGVKCENFVFTEVSDEKGYIDALGQKRTAEVKRDAQIGQAEADREATIKSSTAKREAEEERLRNEAQVADANRDLAVKKAKYDAEVQAEQARAALAGQIAKAEREKDLKLKVVEVERTEVEARTGVAERQAALAEKELVATKIRPAEAEREAAAITAEGQKRAQLITAEAARQASIIQAEGLATAAESAAKAAEQEAAATVARANAAKHKLTAEGEGAAAAQAALTEKTGRAEAEVTRLRLTAQAEGTKAQLLAAADGAKAQGEADGTAIRAKLLAEADGIEKKNAALAQMSEGARLILVLDRLPAVLEHGGDALAKALGPAFAGVGAGLAAVDKIEIVDFGGGNGQGGSAVERFALAVPQIVVKMLTEGRSLGVDVEGLLAKAGIHMTKSRAPSDDKAGA